MNDNAYAEWIIKDTWAQVKPALLGYVIVLTLYWSLIG